MARQVYPAGTVNSLSQFNKLADAHHRVYDIPSRLVMAKQSPRKLPRLEDVLADRVRPDARDLVALIHDVNPTGLNLDRKETARRYALKSRLQSVLIRRFPDDIDAFPEPKEPGIVGLRYQPLDLEACHALLAELDEDARSRVQHILDTREDEVPRDYWIAGQKSLPQPRRHDATRQDDETLQTLLDEGAAALEAYDYELAKERFETALKESHGGRNAARALLSLLVEQMGADEDALAIQDKLDVHALSDAIVRSHLAMAAARVGDRQRALNLVEERGIKLQPGVVADVFVLLAKHELTLGNLVQVKADLNRAMEFVGTHPEFAGLHDALSKARSAARGPQEAEIAHLFANGQVREALERANDLLARFPESDVARKIKQAIEEQKKRNEARVLFDEGRTALESGNALRAQSLFRSALALGLPAEDVAAAEKHLADIEHTERTRIEEARMAEALRVLNTHDLAQGLSLYAALSDSSRHRVAAQFGAPVITWLEELHTARGGGKPNATITAILALHEATRLVSSDPAAALERLAAQDKLLRGFEPAEQMRKAAQTALTDQQRRIAQSRMEAARKALLDGDPNLAERISNDVQEKHLPEDDARAFGELRARIQNIIERNALEAQLEQQRRRNDPVTALGTATRLAGRSEGPDAERIAGICAELREETRRAFSVRVENAGDNESPEWNCLQDIRALPKYKWETMLPDLNGGPDDFLLIVPHTGTDWVFIRAIDVKSGHVHTRVMLRTPTRIDLVHFCMRNRHLILVGRFGAFLEIDVDDWSVQQWYPTMFRTVNIITVTEKNHPSLDTTFPALLIEGAALSPDNQYLWVNTVYTRLASKTAHRTMHVFEIDGMKAHRDVRLAMGERMGMQPIVGVEKPCIAICQDEDDRSEQKTTFYDSRGRHWENEEINLPIEPTSIIACPDGKHIFGVTSDPNVPRGNAETVPWGYSVMLGGTHTFRLLPEITAIYHVTAITSREAQMSFLVFWTRYKCEMLALRQETNGFEIAYRLRLPRYSTLVGTPDGRYAALLVIHQNRAEIVRLGATPPTFDHAEDLPPFRLPSLPGRTVFAKQMDCDEPTGAWKTAVDALTGEIRKQDRTRCRERIFKTMKKADPDELFVLDRALQNLAEPQVAGEVSAHMELAFPNYARGILSSTRRLASTEAWTDVLTKLQDIDPASLTTPEIQHLHHMRGLALMMLDNPEAAIVEFDLGLACNEGSCAIEELLALCVPLSDTERTWSKEGIVSRAWLAQVKDADEALERKDPGAARRAVDVTPVWEAHEVQSLARLTEAYLGEGQLGSAVDPFRKALALMSFCELFDARKSIHRRDVPLPRATWPDEKLKPLYMRAVRWVEETFEKKQD